MNPYEETLLRARDAERADELRSLQASGTVVRAHDGRISRWAAALFGRLRWPARHAVRRPPAAVLDTVDQPAVVVALELP